MEGILGFFTPCTKIVTQKQRCLYFQKISRAKNIWYVNAADLLQCKTKKDYSGLSTLRQKIHFSWQKEFSVPQYIFHHWCHHSLKVIYKTCFWSNYKKILWKSRDFCLRVPKKCVQISFKSLKTNLNGWHTIFLLCI